MFSVGDKIVHPMHGAGVIESIVDEKIGKNLVRFYVFRMPVSGLTLKIPTENSDMIGIRAVLPAGEIERVLAQIPALSMDMTTNWNHRYRENMERIKSGDLLEVAGVIKALMHRDGERGLSTGERRRLLFSAAGPAVPSYACLRQHRGIDALLRVRILYAL